MVKMRFNLVFFSAQAVVQAMDKATRRALSRAGAFVRTRARSRMRKRKKISEPGKPPHSHAGQLRKLLFFAWDAGAESVVIGPARFKQGEAPNLLEFGGTVVRRVFDRRRKTFREVRMVYRPRPFMGPALAAELPQVPKRWRNSIKGGASGFATTTPAGPPGGAGTREGY